jgi:hypothetical protein
VRLPERSEIEMLQKEIARKNDELYQLRKLLTQKGKHLVHVEGSKTAEKSSRHQERRA